MPEPRIVREHRAALVFRVRILSLVVTGLLAVVASGFWFVQVAKGSYYRDLADNNRLRKRTLPALRGQILDRGGRVLAGNVASYGLWLDPERSENPDRTLTRAAELLHRPLEQLAGSMARDRERGGGVRPLLLGQNLTLSDVARIGALALELPELEVGVTHLRLYRQGEQTAHLLGYLGEVDREELERPDSSYRLGDLAGRKGVERLFESVLRGEDGERVVVVDSRGRVVEEFAREQPRSGQDVVLTLELELQQEAFRQLGDRVGAVVALDPRTGAIRALVSTPSFDPNRMVRHLDSEEWNQLVSAPHHPLQNRALQNAYPPGSIFKIAVALAGLEAGAVGPEDRVWCGGSTRIYNHRFRCWRRGGHGWVDLEDAIKGSCDVYFYHLGQKLGIRAVSEYARRLGLGAQTGFELGGEKAGLVPDPEWSKRARGTPWYPGETISVAIGQGPLLVTPLQLAVLLATVANGGAQVTPHLVEGEAPSPRAIEIDQPDLEEVRRGLWAVVNDEKGTGRFARLDSFEVAGKTGTAQVVSQETWTENKELPAELRDHAWFASFAPYEDPRLVVVVFVEHGGQGSRAAAPVAKALYVRFFELHPGI